MSLRSRRSGQGLCVANPVLSNRGASDYTQNYVAFDGSTYLELGADSGPTPIFTGQADLTELSMCLWLNMTTATTTAAYHIFAASGATTTILQFNKSTTGINSNRFRFRGTNSGVTQLQIDSVSSITAATGLKCILISSILGGASQMYFGDVDEKGTTTEWTGAAIDFSLVDIFKFSNFATGQKLIGQVGGFALYPTRYDFSVEANRRLFIDAGGNPVSPPSGALIKFGFEQKANELSGNAAQGWNDGYNQGTGGGTFTVTGAVTDV